MSDYRVGNRDEICGDRKIKNRKIKNSKIKNSKIKNNEISGSPVRADWAHPAAG